jgi:uncharacterized protein (DUF1778 family)
MPVEPTRTARIEAWIASAAEDAAKNSIDEVQILRLSVADQRAFVEAILSPPPLAPAMERAVERHRKLVAASR